MGVEIQMNPNRRSVENRQARRYRYRGEATLRLLGAEQGQQGSLLDLSLQGCLLRVPELTGIGVDSSVEVAIASNFFSFRALGTVRYRAERRRLLGISFVNLTSRGEAELLELIADLDASQRTARGSVEEIKIER